MSVPAGPRGLLRRIARKAAAWAGLALAVPPVLLARLMRPLVLIRFGRLFSDRIGHFALDAEFYLCERALGMQEAGAVDVFGFGYGGPVCNRQLKEMVSRALRTSSFGRHLYLANRALPGGERHTVTIIGAERHGCRDVDGVLRRAPVQLSFTPEEERRGRRALLDLGVPAGAPFVCFHARDAAYLESAFPRGNWRYHDYRDSDIRNYLPAVEALARRGNYALRMGAVVKEAIRPADPKVIDYAVRGRTDFLDVYLGAKCRFFLGSCTGIDAVATAHRRPIAYVNVAPLEYVPSWSADYLIIPKKLWLTAERRFMGFREVLASGAGRFLDGAKFRERGIEVVENTAEEIAAVTLEMDERLAGTWKGAPEDEELQNKFRSLFKPGALHGPFLARLGADFLRRNRGLLEAA